MSSSQRTKTENRKNIATSSIRTLKDGSQLKKKNLKEKKREKKSLKLLKDLPGSPVVSHCRGHEFDP